MMSKLVLAVALAVLLLDSVIPQTGARELTSYAPVPGPMHHKWHPHKKEAFAPGEAHAPKVAKLLEKAGKAHAPYEAAKLIHKAMAQAPSPVVAALYERTLKAAAPTEAKHLEAGKAKEASWEAKHHHVPAPAP
ncbi:hypothetical protein CVIRNUC_008786 [Coccomyxa viridis]|uniref:Uncharacterized protein n=1 Tax=Coccomyxa viridis TaxID=1274662 RepID=A0AAV1IFJ6_9CHLO|nr:hypothetical protein CVIRNUC_008786 [Coccomyxa viridis]